MGLDMHLLGERYIWKHTNEPQEDLLRNKVAQATGFKPNQVQGIKLDLGYWRKANHIHNWFVENIQGGEDNCRQYHVERSELMDLKHICQRIMDRVENGDEWKSYAEEVLPCCSGFFFGSTEIDEYYLEACKETIRIIDNIITDPALTDVDLYYASSW